jgi:hypothetical protein
MVCVTVTTLSGHYNTTVKHRNYSITHTYTHLSGVLEAVCAHPAAVLAACGRRGPTGNSTVTLSLHCFCSIVSLLLRFRHNVVKLLSHWLVS